MTVRELVYAQALTLAGPMDSRQEELLKLLCGAAVQGLEGRLKEGLTAESCKADFVAAASLYALSALNETGERVEEFRAGDLTIRQGGGSDAASRCLRRQAEMMISPYLESGFLFMGV